MLDRCQQERLETGPFIEGWARDESALGWYPGLAGQILGVRCLYPSALLCFLEGSPWAGRWPRALGGGGVAGAKTREGGEQI